MQSGRLAQNRGLGQGGGEDTNPSPPTATDTFKCDFTSAP